MTWRLENRTHISIFKCIYAYLSLSLTLFHLSYSVLPCSVSYDAISDAANMRDDYRYVASFLVTFPHPFSCRRRSLSLWATTESYPIVRAWHVFIVLIRAPLSVSGISYCALWLDLPSLWETNLSAVFDGGGAKLRPAVLRMSHWYD